jgi:apolipoprotein N-acyltransferase
VTLIQRTLLTSLAALLIALSFHPIGLYFCAWFGLVPFLYAIEGQNRTATFRMGVLFGFLLSLFSLFWLVFLQIDMQTRLIMLFGLIIMFLYIGLFFGSGFLVSRILGLWSLPFILTGLEFVRGIGELGFPWLFLGYSQARYPIVIQQASVWGVYGITFWLIAGNISFFRMLKSRTLKNCVICLCIYALPLVYGAVRLKNAQVNVVSVGIVQPNIDPNLKFTRAMREESFNRLISLSELCADEAYAHGDTLALIIWPETATPVFLRYPGQHQERVNRLATQLRVPIFTGTPLLEHRRIYNGAVLVAPGQGIVEEYRKLHLVPFGEHIPFAQYIPFLGKIDVGGGDYTPGDVFTVFSYGPLRFSCLICFESIFPEISHSFIAHGACMLVNITNDGWFGRISGSQQHNDMAILRAVENGVPLCRSANTGISMIVDQYGRVKQETDLFVQDFIYDSISLQTKKTLYRTIGAGLPILSLILCTIAISALYVRAMFTFG